MPYVEHVQWDVLKNLVLIYRKLFLKAFNQHFLYKMVALRMVFKRNELRFYPDTQTPLPTAGGVQQSHLKVYVLLRRQLVVMLDLNAHRFGGVC